MGDIADMILDGVLCQVCGEYVGEGDGFPITCADCVMRLDHEEPAPGRSPKTNCPVCKKRVKQAGLAMHMRAKHSVAAQAESAR